MPEAPVSLDITAQPGFQWNYFTHHDVDVVVGGGGAGVGKRLSINTPIPTKYGWKTMKDVKVGDEIFSLDGSICRITKVHDIVKDKTYRIIFDDSSEVIACADHLWFTLTYRDRIAIRRRTRQFRNARRSKRNSVHKEYLQDLNIKNEIIGSVKTTQEISKSIYHLKRINHGVPICGPIDLPKNEFLFDPYLIGYWLGDGHSGEGTITTADTEVIDVLGASGHKVTKRKAKYGYHITGLTALIKNFNLRNNKHIPPEYLRSSIEQRKELLMGLMDSDGYCRKDGIMEFCSIHKNLANEFYELICSLGIKSSVKESDAKLYGRIISKRYRISFVAPFYVFKLERKKCRQRTYVRETQKYRYIKQCVEIEAEEMRCITVDSPDGLFLCSKSFIPTHNSWSLLIDAAWPVMQYYHSKGKVKPKSLYAATVFRRTYPEIENPGGLWDASQLIYPYFRGMPTESDKEWKFMGDKRKEFAKVVFRHMQREEDKTAYQGSELPFIGFDELTHFEKSQFMYLMSRNRSMCGIPPRVRATCNPDADSWVADMIDWYIGEDGYIRKDRDCKVRYFTVDKDKFVWGDSKAEVVEKMAYKFDLIPHANKEDLVKSFAFVEGDIHDNQKLLKSDPQYLANLLSLSEEDQMRLYRKNWKIKIEKNLIIDFKMLQNVFTNDFVSLGQKYITCDIATTGRDLFIIMVWSGKRLIDIDICASNSGKEAIDMIEAKRKLHGVMNTNILFDADGVGGGLTGWITNCVEFKGNHAPIGKQNYRNLKNQCYFELSYCINQTNEKSNMDMYYIEPQVYDKIFEFREPQVYSGRTIKWILEDQMKAIRKDKPDLDGKLSVIRKDEQKTLIHGLSPDFMDCFMMREYFERFTQNRFVNM